MDGFAHSSAAAARFNPLHCGAVVASERTAVPGGGEGLFQSPSLRGSGRFPQPPRSPYSPHGGRFNPLHCGAVVASLGRADRRREDTRVSIPFIAGQWSLLRSWTRPPMRRPGFNPLHCGAVVASFRRRGCGARRQRVSIPFIAGQWSLLRSWTRPPMRRPGFNPLHCGAVVAS